MIAGSCKRILQIISDMHRVQTVIYTYALRRNVFLCATVLYALNVPDFFLPVFSKNVTSDKFEWIGLWG